MKMLQNKYIIAILGLSKTIFQSENCIFYGKSDRLKKKEKIWLENGFSDQYKSNENVVNICVKNTFFCKSGLFGKNQTISRPVFAK